ncbi:MAG TPA: methyltransferase domain-containing protein, partial [Planctomycetaceae bacterium]|nr:methyltransferase domain-containing protein [Planctomycetaceae bacterium]
RRQLFAEIFRVLKPGGRAVISDIVSSEDVPAELQADPRLWSGCLSGAFREDRFLAAFESAGFHGVEMVERQSEPWVTVGRFEFRSLTVRAFKPLPPSPHAHAELDVAPGATMFVSVNGTPSAEVGCCSHESKCC